MARYLFAVGWALGVLSASTAWADRPLDLNIKTATADWLADLEAGGVGHYAVIGDSISFRNDTYVWYLRDDLEARFGSGGDGYLALGVGFKHRDGTNNRRPGLDFRGSTTWREWSDASGPRDDLGLRAVDGIYTRIGATGWFEVDIFGPAATLHYVREVGAGVIRVEVNGETVGEVDASLDSGDPQLGTFFFETGEADPEQTSTVRFSLVGATSDDPQWTQLNGLVMTGHNPGARFSRLARGGVGPEEFMRTPPGIFADTLESIDPDMVIVMLDHVDLGAYEASLNILVDRVEDAVPGAEIVLISHHHFKENLEIDADILVAMADERGHGFINLFDLHTGRDHLEELGFLIDGVHLTGEGGSWFGQYINDALLGWTTATGVEVDAGTVQDGGLYEIRATDDDFFHLRSEIQPFFAERNLVNVRAQFATDVPNPSTIEVRTEWLLDEPGGIAKVAIRNWNTGGFDALGATPLGLEERIDVWDADAAGHVSPDGLVEVRCKHVVLVPFLAFDFETFIDRVHLRVR